MIAGNWCNLAVKDKKSPEAAASRLRSPVLIAENLVVIGESLAENDGRNLEVIGEGVIAHRRLRADQMTEAR